MVGALFCAQGGPGAGKALYIKAYKAGGPLHPPRKSQQQQTKEGGLCGPWSQPPNGGTTLTVSMCL